MDRDWVTTISQHTKDEFCDYTGMSPERVFVTPLAASDLFHPSADAEAGAAREKYGIPDGDYLLSIANPQPNKNLPQLVRAFVRLLMENPGSTSTSCLPGSDPSNSTENSTPSRLVRRRIPPVFHPG